MADPNEKYSALRRDLIDMEMKSSPVEFGGDLFKALFMASPVGIYVVQQGYFQLVNPQFQIDTGYSQRELVGVDSLDLVVPADRDKVRSEALAMIRGRRVSPYEFRTEFKSGGIRWVVGSVSPIVYRGERAILGYYLDITEQRKAHEALATSEARMRDLFDSAPVGYYEVDTEGRIIQVNRTALDMLGYAASEMLGRPGWDFMVEKEESQKAFEAKIAGTAPAGSGFERTFIKKNGDLLQMQMENRLIHDPQGAITGLRSTFQDTTERRQMELELAAQTGDNARLELLNQVAIAMAHHVRNAITPIIGMADLYDPDKPSTGIRLRDTALREGDHIAAIIDALMEISRSGRAPTIEYLGEGSARMLDMDALIEEYVRRDIVKRAARNDSSGGC